MRNSTSRLRFLCGDILPIVYALLRRFPFAYVGYGTRKAPEGPLGVRGKRALIALVADVRRAQRFLEMTP